jgi:hypothetical protein
MGYQILLYPRVGMRLFSIAKGRVTTKGRLLPNLPVRKVEVHVQQAIELKEG